MATVPHNPNPIARRVRFIVFDPHFEEPREEDLIDVEKIKLLTGGDQFFTRNGNLVDPCDEDEIPELELVKK